MPSEQLRETADPCQVHKGKHIPAPHLNHEHHIWPLGDGGPDDPGNIVVVCPTGHANIHALLRLYKSYGGKPPYSETRAFAFGEREYAERGWQAIQRKRL